MEHSSSDSIASKNGRAIVHLQQGHCCEAIAELQEALATMRKTLAEDDAAHRRENSEPKPLITMALEQTTTQLCSTELHHACSSSDNGSLFRVFDRAFLLPENDDAWCTSNPNSATVIILFNMALCHHRAGLKAGSSREFKIALELYKMSLSIFEEYVDQAGNDDSVLTLLLCLFNNMGHIHARHFDVEEARHCMNATHALLASRDLSEFRRSDDLLFFLLGSIFMSEKQLVLAPAA